MNRPCQGRDRICICMVCYWTNDDAPARRPYLDTKPDGLHGVYGNYGKEISGSAGGD
jgi:hypothetical protein